MVFPDLFHATTASKGLITHNLSPSTPTATYPVSPGWLMGPNQTLTPAYKLNDVVYCQFSGVGGCTPGFPDSCAKVAEKP